MMTKKIKCPCCGSERIDNGPTNECLDETQDWYFCADCQCEWAQKRRKLPTITPEMAWKWFCRTIFRSMPYVESIRISANNYLDFYFNESVQQWQRGGLYVHSNIVEALGWQDMPPMTRKDFANE